MVDYNIVVESPDVDAPVSVNFGGFFTDFKNAIDGLVDDVKKGDAIVLTGVMLAGMFVFAGVYLWRRV